jgi:hypothetical protein
MEMKTKMKTETFTVNRAAQVLNHDRRTLVKALRKTPPATVVKGQSQWELETIRLAVNRLPSVMKAKADEHRHSDDYVEDRYPRDDWEDPQNIADMFRDRRIILAQEEFNEAFEAMTRLPTVAARRSAARPLAKKLVANHENTCRRAEEIGVDWDVYSHRADTIVRLTLPRLQEACGWTRQELRAVFDETWWNENTVDPDGD